MFGKEQRDFANITDGSSNTIWAVEVNPELAVPWTQPADWTPNERNPMEGLGGVNAGGFIATMVDGSVHFVSNNIDPESWQAMLTINGGEVANLDD